MQERKRLSDILPQSERDNLARLWDSTKPADDLGLLPEGKYHCRIIDGTAFTAKTGTRGFKITYEIVDGVHAGRWIWSEPMWFTPDAMAITRRELARIGIDRMEQLDHPIPRGILATVKLKVRRDEDGIERNRVTSFRVTGIEVGEPDPFAPDAGSGDGSTTDEPERFDPVDGSTADAGGFDWSSGRQAGEATP
jgi:hypothetical protein